MITQQIEGCVVKALHKAVSARRLVRSSNETPRLVPTDSRANVCESGGVK